MRTPQTVLMMIRPMKVQTIRITAHQMMMNNSCSNRNNDNII